MQTIITTTNSDVPQGYHATPYITKDVDSERWSYCYNKFDAANIQYVNSRLIIAAVVGTLGGALIGVGLLFGMASFLQWSFGWQWNLLIVIGLTFGGTWLAHWLMGVYLYTDLNRKTALAMREHRARPKQSSRFEKADDNDLRAIGWVACPPPPPASSIQEFLRNKILRAGLVKWFTLTLEDGKIYVVNVGYGDWMVYQRGVDEVDETFDIWRLTVAGGPPLKVYALDVYPKDPGVSNGIAVTIPEVPSYSEDDVHDKISGWVHTNYNVILTLKIEAANLGLVLAGGVRGIESIRARTKAIGKTWFAYVPYKEVTAADFAQEFQKRLLKDEQIKATGFTIKVAEITVKGDPALSDAMRNQFKIFQEASLHLQNRMQAAQAFSQMDQQIFTRLLEAENGEEALRMRGRASNQMLNALMVDGKLSALQALQMTSTVAGALTQQHTDPLQQTIAQDAARLANKQFAQQVGEGKATWPKIDTATPTSHAERLQHEREHLELYASETLLPIKHDHTFVFGFPSAGQPIHTLEIVWKNDRFPPELYWDGQIWSQEYPHLLGSAVFNYRQVTVFDLYLAVCEKEKV